MGAAKKHQIQEMSIKAIRVDHDLQSRVETNLEVVKGYADALLSGAFFPAVVVFFDGKTYWLADGFHRLAAYKRAGRVSISADVKEGSKRDAIFFSAGANAKMGVRPTPNDNKKSVFMLFNDSEWFRWSDGLIAKHCGVGSTTVNRLRAEYCLEKGVPIPEKVLCVSGQTGEVIEQSYRKTLRKIRKQTKKGKGTSFTAKVDGKTTYLGSTEQAAKRKLHLLILERREINSILSDRGRLVQFMIGAGIVSRAANGAGEHPTGVIGNDFVCVSMSDFEPSSIYRAVGNVLILGEMIAHESRKIIVRDPAEPSPTARKLMDYASLAGIEFLTPGEIVEQFGPGPPPDADGIATEDHPS